MLMLLESDNNNEDNGLLITDLQGL